MEYFSNSVFFFRKLFAILLGFIVFIGICMLKNIIEWSNAYEYSNRDCNELQKFYSDQYVVSSSKYSSWHHKLYLTDGPLVTIPKCPTIWGESYTLSNGQLIGGAEFKLLDELTGKVCTLKDCNGKEKYIVTQEISNSTIVNDKFFYKYEIKKVEDTKQEIIGHVVKYSSIGLSMILVDNQSNIVANVDHVYSVISLSLKWNVKIFQENHPLSDSFLILSLLGMKMKVGDICNYTYLFFLVTQYLSIIFIPLITYFYLGKVKLEEELFQIRQGFENRRNNPPNNRNNPPNSHNENLPSQSIPLVELR